MDSNYFERLFLGILLVGPRDETLLILFEESLVPAEAA
jgi:hypothetical protein